MKSQTIQRMDSEDAIVRAKMVAIIRGRGIVKDDAQMARCFKVSNENMWSIIKFAKKNKWLLEK